MTISNDYYGLMGQAVEEAIKNQFPLLVPDGYAKGVALRVIDDKGFGTEDIQIVLPKEVKKDKKYVVFDSSEIIKEILNISSVESLVYTDG